MGNKTQKPKEVKSQESMKAEFSAGTAVPAVIEDLIGRTGFRGEITQVKCRILQGNDKGKERQKRQL